MRIKHVVKRLDQMMSSMDAGQKQVVPPYITSPPGWGKSAVVKQLAEKRGIPLIDVRLAQMAPEDLRGVPFPIKEDQTTYWFPPNMLPRGDGKSILFMDEIDKCNPAVQNAALQLLLDRKCGDYEVPEGCFMVGAGNRVEDNAYSISLSTALANRLAHVKLETTLGDWTDWGLENDIRQDIIGFMQFRPVLLYEKELKEGMTAYPTPRSWEFFSRLLNQFGDHDGDVIDAGTMTVGEGPAREFLAYKNIYSGIDVKGILSGAKALPDLSSKKTEQSYLYAFVCATGFYVKEHGVDIHKSTPGTIMSIMESVGIEHRAAFAKIIAQRRGTDVKLAAYDKARWFKIVKGITEILKEGL